MGCYSFFFILFSLLLILYFHKKLKSINLELKINYRKKKLKKQFFFYKFHDSLLFYT